MAIININWLKKHIPRKTLSYGLILATLGAAVYYFYTHRSILNDLHHISPAVGGEVLAMYIVMLVVLVIIYWATMRLVNVKVPIKENGLINVYSLFMNFFIPGQTGAAFRAYYMKKHYKLKYLDYIIATIIYYLIYGLLSVMFVLAGSQPYFISLPVVLGIVLVSVLGLRLYIKRKKQARLNLSIKNIGLLVLATFAQLVVQGFIYFIEIHSVKSGIHLSQLVTYTGTANLALFVALTPGAIGIREGFLILSERLNHLTSSTIILANVVDRSVYIIYLLVLGLLIAALKVRDRLDPKQSVS